MTNAEKILDMIARRSAMEAAQKAEGAGFDPAGFRSPWDGELERLYRLIEANPAAAAAEYTGSVT